MNMSVGINLYSVFRELNEDFLGTLERVAKMGYTHVELISANFSTGVRFSDTFTVPVIKQKLDELGLHAFAAHEGVAPGQELIDGDWDAIIKINEELGCRSIVLPFSFIQGREDTLKAAEQMNAIGKKVKAAGMEFYYHNHAHEFARAGDTSLFHILAENTDPEYVKFELDLVWVMRGGYDPIDILNMLGSRCDMIHQKDLSKQVLPVNLFDAIAEEDKQLNSMQVLRKYVRPEDIVNLGTGIFDFEKVYQKMKDMGHICYAIVENEGNQGDKLTSIASDLQVITKYVNPILHA